MPFFHLSVMARMISLFKRSIYLLFGEASSHPVIYGSATQFLDLPLVWSLMRILGC
uniref:Uncharacterized protein n=1 Tax=Picea glauca TaxID=3330 RepID=A0A124GNX5_PICGL|nr:hypothetical protein ABT39_MTgene25 [Picea glauca]QHR89347.1 hypothetical protein Q903MT_gene3368 [Picea sitchensis]